MSRAVRLLALVVTLVVGGGLLVSPADALKVPASQTSGSSGATTSANGSTGSAHRARAVHRVAVGRASVRPAASQLLGPAPKNAHLRLSVALAPRDPAALEAEVAAVSTPGSPQYKHYLAKGQFASKFGPTEKTVAAVRAALVRAGLKPGRTSANRLSIAVKATVSQAERAWGVSINSYRLASGRTVLSNVGAPLMDSSVAAAVQGVIGLDGFEVMQPQVTHSSGAGAHPAAPPPAEAAAIPGQPTACMAAATDGGAWTAENIAQAYDFLPLYRAGSFGQGQTVDLFELSAYLSSDISTYQTCYGTSVPVSDVPIDGGQSTNSAPAGNGPIEVVLDAEDVIGLAPKMTRLNIYDAPNCSGCTAQFDEWTAMATNDDAQVVSTSWGACEQGMSGFDTTIDTILQQMAVQGMTVLGATGDAGADACGTTASPALGVQFPTSSPNITGVGGTNLNAINDPPTSPPSETAWSGSTGGISTVFQLPPYQNFVIDSTSSGTPCGNTTGKCREVPDVSADAGVNYAIYNKGGWGGVGGTSAATPTWAALAAIINSSAPSCNVGFMNITLYEIGDFQYTSNSGDYFNDPNSGNNDVGGVGYSAANGYDMVTGLGTPVGANLAQGFCARTATSTTVSTSGTPSQSGHSVTFTATVSPTDGGGTVAFYADGSDTALAGCDQVALDASHKAACSTSSLAPGDHFVEADYSGDTTGYLPSSGQVSQRVQATTNTTVTVAPDPSVYPAPVTFTATVAPTDGGGSVSFYLDGSATALCSAVSLTPVSGSYQAACTDSSPFPLAGSHSIVATYSGDNYYLTSSGNKTFTISLALTAPPLPNPTWQASYSTTVSAAGGTGSITFSKISGSLPTGLSLGANGMISGTPTDKAQLNQTFTFTVKATDSIGATGSQQYSIKLLSPCGAGLTPYILSATSRTGNFTGLFCVNNAGSGTYAQTGGPHGTGTVTISGGTTHISAYGTNLALLGQKSAAGSSFTESAPAPIKAGTFILL
jgi:hypothetical protein